MSEGSLWKKLRKNMVPRHWDEATRHEDKLQKGIADVSFCQSGNHGWIELKHSDLWPIRPATIVRLPHYHDDQRNFLRDKGSAAGNTWLFLQVDRDHLLFDWSAADLVGKVNTSELEALAYRTWIGRKLDYLELAIAMEQ
jgi:hypothetical protein